MSDQPEGIDVSKWQPNLDWNKASTRAKFGICRAGSIDNVTGICYTDYEFNRNSSIAPGIMPTGYYWYLRPNWSINRQADFFSSLLINVKRHFPPAVDVEAPPDTWGRNITPKEYADILASFFFRLMNNLSIPKLLIYSRVSYWDTYIEHRDGWSVHDLWISRFNPLLSSPWSDGKYVPRDWRTYKFWQYTNKGDGLSYGTTPSSLQIDLNKFNGTLDELYAYADWELSQRDMWMKSIDSWARTEGYNGIKPV